MAAAAAAEPTENALSLAAFIEMKIEFQLLVAAAAVVCRLCGMKGGEGERVHQSALCNYKSETRYGAFISVTIHCAHRLSFALTGGRRLL